MFDLIWFGWFQNNTEDSEGIWGIVRFSHRYFVFTGKQKHVLSFVEVRDLDDAVRMLKNKKNYGYIGISKLEVELMYPDFIDMLTDFLSKVKFRPWPKLEEVEKELALA